MVGFHRRFDIEYVKAKEYVENWTGNGENLISSILIESYDPVPADEGLHYVVYNSICHDVDILYFICGFDADIKVNSTNVEDKSESSIRINGTINSNIEFVIRYKKVHPSYVQRITFNDEKSFGYDYSGEPCCGIYADAYKKQWQSFVENVKSLDPDSNKERLLQYSKTFATLEEAANLLPTNY